MGQFISPDITVGTYTRARLVVDFAANASSNNNAVKAYVQMWRTNTGYTTYGEGTLYIGIDGYGWAQSAITTAQKITYNSYTQIGSTRSLNISMDNTGRWTGKFYVYTTTNNANLTFSQEEYTITLEPCPVYTLSISAGTGSSITVNRTSSAGGGSTGNLSAGTKKLYYGDKLKITFTPSTNYSITTHTVNNSAFTSGGSHTVSDDVTVRATATPLKSLVAATDANIGSTSSIIITRYNNSYTHTLTYKFGSLTGTIATNTAETTVPFPVPPAFYAQIPDDPYGICTITCTTYNGSTPLGDTPCTMKVTADKSVCAPKVNVTAEDGNDATFALTGDRKKIIKFHSDITVNANVTEQNKSKIKSTTLKCGTRTANVASYTFTDAESIDISATAIDSRDYDTIESVKDLTLIEYIKLTNNAAVARTSPTADTVIVTTKGMYYNGSFGVVNNTLGLQVQYKPKTKEAFDETDNWTEMAVTLDGNTYTAEATLTGLDYKQAYDIRVRAIDQIYNDGPLANAVEHTVTLNKGIPVFDWGEEDFNFNVPVSITGNMLNDFVIEQGTDGIWIYRKWVSGIAECWARLSNQKTTAEWSTTQAYVSISLPFAFAEPPVVTCSGCQNEYAGSYIAYTDSSSTSVGAYMQCTAAPSDTAYCTFCFQVKGKWQ